MRNVDHPLTVEAGAHGAADRFIAQDSGRLRYRDEAPDETASDRDATLERPALLLLHGWALELRMWDFQVPRLVALGYRVIRMDRRGFGHSTGVPGAGHDASDAHHLLRQLGIERAAVLGMSQGARAAILLAQEFPGVVTALVLDGPPEFDPLIAHVDDERIPVERYERLLHSSGLHTVREELMRHPLMRLRTTDRAARALLLEILGRYGARDLLERAAVDPVPVPAGPMSLPVLVINGAHDNAQRLAAGERLARRLGAEHALVPASGHLPNLDNPAAYHAILERFLARHGPPVRRRGTGRPS
jgi:pimeloyl-ACP methyl ester carboxylesterase